jgi:hypothetical protein
MGWEKEGSWLGVGWKLGLGSAWIASPRESELEVRIR